MASRAEHLLGALVTRNNALVHARATDADEPNPRPLARHAWTAALAARYPVVRAEWDSFVAAGGHLPRLSDLIQEDQGEDGTWRAGLLVARGRVVPALAEVFPRTIATLAGVPGLRSALWSVLEPGTELPEHRGPNAGVLRYHLGVVCVGDTALRVGDSVVAYREGEGVLFDDTAPHAAWNRSDVTRVTLFCELLRPARGAVAARNRATQAVIALDRRYRAAPARAATFSAAARPGVP